MKKQSAYIAMWGILREGKMDIDMIEIASRFIKFRKRDRQQILIALRLIDRCLDKCESVKPIDLKGEF